MLFSLSNNFKQRETTKFLFRSNFFSRVIKVLLADLYFNSHNGYQHKENNSGFLRSQNSQSSKKLQNS